ncbi:MAG: tRNA (adenosine(37)-N6)-threonylcarbamoyltransferase complex ATPase subunit type 1 TsaE [Desulfobacterales bacterium]|jgi:tRNA threonylcarbamoyladenosine biosynthesis protein TsaE|nr:tRNA (adenosine(37)-N6)-threonylcarbamoyltransferase complex ATPase subunit type 1 TsaE [Desulfobacterales bacterium]
MTTSVYPKDAVRTVTTAGAEETRELGGWLGRLLSTPLVIFLLGELGSGKTMFVQGLARGLDVPPHYYITSPSYTLIHEYPGRLTLHHIDLYRLDVDLDPEDLGLNELLHGNGVAAVEWADRLPSDAVADRMEIRFEIGAGDHRTLQLLAYGQAATSLLKALDRFTGSSPAEPVRA